MNKLILRMMLVVLVALTVPVASADYNMFHLEPVDSSCDNPGDTTNVWVKVNTSYDDINGVQASIIFDPSVVNVTLVEKGTNPAWYMWEWQIYHKYGYTYVYIKGADPMAAFGPGEIEIGKMTLRGEDIGVSSLHFADESEVTGYDMTMIVNPTNTSGIWPITLEDGTFTCGDPLPEVTFTKPLPEGWNLISLPLAPTDNSVGTVLSGVTQNDVKLYNATTKLFEDVSTMDPGVGYFVHVTESGGSTWSYQGSPVSSTSPGLKSGLNMIGVPNCTMSVDTAMGSADYRYVARWDADAQEYEVYNPLAPSVFHGFTEMTAGEGYFVSAKSDGALTVTCPS